LKIKQIEAYKIPMEVGPHFAIAPRKGEYRPQWMIKAVTMGKRALLRSAPRKFTRNIALKIVDDSGICGWGEAAACKSVTAETVKTILHTLSRFVPALIGKSITEIDSYMKALDSIVTGNTAAKACVDIALHDLLGKISGKSVYLLLGGSKREVMTDFSIGMNRAEKMAQEAQAAVEKGFKAIKIKVGGQPSKDYNRIQLVRQAIGNEVKLRVDANEGWTVNQAVDLVRKLDKFDLQFIEQPVFANDLKGLETVRKNSEIPIMADEAVHSVEDAKRVIQAEAADLINIKLMKCGGIVAAVKIAKLAEKFKIPCMMGCMAETRLSITAAVHTTASIENITYADLDSDLFYNNRLVRKGGATIENSMRKLTATPGLGITEMNVTKLGKPVMIYP
jgi:o-succinylbenzoate synthase